jgi:fatty-acyl-CoA synthase
MLYGEKQVVFCDERVFIYRELSERVNRFSYDLVDLGAEKGDQVNEINPTYIFKRF